jgi:hypothetical protein
VLRRQLVLKRSARRYAPAPRCTQPDGDGAEAAAADEEPDFKGRHGDGEACSPREARVQHLQLEGFGRKLEIALAAGTVDRETLDAAGELLHAHIRLEERQLFPLIEELVPDDELQRLGLAGSDVTLRRSAPAPDELVETRSATRALLAGTQPESAISGEQCRRRQPVVAPPAPARPAL